MAIYHDYRWLSFATIVASLAPKRCKAATAALPMASQRGLGETSAKSTGFYRKKPAKCWIYATRMQH